LSIGDSDALLFLIAASEQDDDAVAVLAKIDAVTGSEIDFVLVNSGADSFDIGEIAVPEPIQGDCNFRGGG
jgi:hypothetical protein